MADNGKGDGAAGPGSVGVDDAVDWTYQLMTLERVTADPKAEEDGDSFVAKFQVDGPNANAEVEIIVSEFDDDADVISLALHTLHVAMRTWGRVTESRRIEARDFAEQA